MAPYAVDNERFRLQAEALRGQRSAVRGQWGIPEDAYCVLFCGKFIPKKRPMDLIRAASILTTNNSLTNNRFSNIHLLFVGSGELGGEMRAACNVVFDGESSDPSINKEQITNNQKPRASFAGFLNQTEISRAYVAADVLVLPSDYAETWGLVVNEAMASGLPCVISDRCGSGPDLGACIGNAVFPCGDVAGLADRIAEMALTRPAPPQPPAFRETVEVVRTLCLAA